MKRTLNVCLTLLLAAGAPAGARAEDSSAEPLFLTLTRDAAPLDRLPANVTVVTAEDIRRSGARTLDEVLDLLPGVRVERAGTLGSFAPLRLRGAPSSAHTQVLVDDRPLGGVSLQFTDLSQIPVHNVDRVEIVRGGSSVLYGANATGGVVNVITKSHASGPPSTALRFESRSFRTRLYKGEFGAAGRGFDAYVSGGKYTTDGFQQNGDARNVTVQGRGGYTFESGARLELDLSRADHDVGDPQGTLLPPDQWDGKKERAAADSDARVAKNETAARLKATAPLGGGIILETALHGARQDYLTRPKEDAPAGFDQDNRILGGDARLRLGKGPLLGLAYERDVQKEDVGNTAHHVTNAAAYLQQRLAWGALDLIPAVRLDRHSAFGSVVNPRLSAVYRARRGLRLSANAARSFRAPSFLELFYQSSFFNGNPDLRPETAWTFDLGAAFQPGQTLRLSLVGFHSRLRERIAATSDTYINAPRAELSGLEAEAAHDLPGGLSGRAGYTYQRAVANAASRSRYLPLRLTPRHAASYRLSWALPRGWAMDNTLRYAHKQFEKDGEAGLKLPSYTLWNVRVTKRLLGAEISLAADNVTDKRYTETFGTAPISFQTTRNPLPGRTFWGGVSLRFED